MVQNSLIFAIIVILVAVLVVKGIIKKILGVVFVLLVVAFILLKIGVIGGGVFDPVEKAKNRLYAFESTVQEVGAESIRYTPDGNIQLQVEGVWFRIDTIKNIKVSDKGLLTFSYKGKEYKTEDNKVKQVIDVLKSNSLM